MNNKIFEALYEMSELFSTAYANVLDMVDVDKDTAIVEYLAVFERGNFTMETIAEFKVSRKIWDGFEFELSKILNKFVSDHYNIYDKIPTSKVIEEYFDNIVII